MKYDVKELAKVIDMLKGLEDVEMTIDSHNRLSAHFSDQMGEVKTEVILYPVMKEGKSLNAEIKTTKKL